MSPGLECDLRNIDVETVSDIAEEAEYMLVSHNFAPERANQTYFKISVILLSSTIHCLLPPLKLLSGYIYPGAVPGYGRFWYSLVGDAHVGPTTLDNRVVTRSNYP